MCVGNSLSAIINSLISISKCYLDLVLKFLLICGNKTLWCSEGNYDVVHSYSKHDANTMFPFAL